MPLLIFPAKKYVTYVFIVLNGTKFEKRSIYSEIDNPSAYLFLKNSIEIIRRRYNELIKKIEEKGWSKQDKNISIQRFKGLGEMQPEELWETTMNPETRVMLRVRLEDAVEANEIFSDLMGEKVEPRKEFIQENAQFVKNLDI